MRRLSWIVPGLLGLGLVVGIGCNGSISGLINSSTGTGGTTGPTGAGGDTGTSSTAGLGIPCAIQQVLQVRCQGCHSNPPIAGAPMPLMNLADLRAPAMSNPMVTVASMVGLRISSTTAPMPPKSAVPATPAEIKIVTDWVSGGAQAGLVCGATTSSGSGGSAGKTGTTGSGGSSGGIVGGTAGSTGTTANSGLPCNVQAILQATCQHCHSNPPQNGAPMPLVTFADLTAKSFADPSATFAQRAVVRITNTLAPMPPVGNPPLSAADVAAISSWVASNTPMGTCGMTTSGAGGATGTVTGTGGSTGTVTGAGGSTGTAASGVPCNVRAVLQKWCLGCHTNPPLSGAPMPLVSYANLTAKSFADPNATFAQRAISRMTNTATPMPPGTTPVVPAADVATVMSWVASQYPMATATCTTTGAGGATGGGVAGTSGGMGGAGGSTTTVANGIPCDVATLLQNRCVACHRNPPINGAPMPLLTYANLTAPSTANPAQTFAQRALVRMQGNPSQMPPLPNASATAAEMTAMSNWINAKYPMGTCMPTTTGAGGATGAGGVGGATGAGGAGGGTAVGLPCDVQTVFQSHCTTCHATVPISGAPMPLVTRANLVAPSFANPAQTFAQRAVMRMQGAPSQMPPSPGTPPTGAEITTVNNWVLAGYPGGTCGTTVVPPPPDPLNARAICTSNRFWSQGNEGSPLMNPGLSCLGCHNGGGGGGGGEDSGGGEGEGGEAPLYTIAGTLYPTGHEPNLCNGTAGAMAAARVVIVDAAKRTITLTPNAAGNFFYAGTVTFPVHAKVTYQGRERIMTAAQSNGSCNACHTQNGANGAPGRITLP